MRHCLYLCLFILAGYFLEAQSTEVPKASEPICFGLLIGIDQYQHLPPELWLDGCYNDVELLRLILTKRFGVLPANLVVLLNEQATRQGILDQWKVLSAKTKAAGPGAKVVFFYSGHGSQKKDLDGDEPDGKDETLVTYDSSLAEGDRDILDDELQIFLQELVAAQAHVTVILDCCHSGTGIRGNTKTRSLDRKCELAADEIALRGVKISIRPSLPGVVFLSACQAHEKEPEYHERENNKTFGMLTYHLAKAIEKEGENATYRSVFKNIETFYANLPQAPLPSLEGDSSKLIFGVKARFLPKVCRVLTVDTEQKTVNLDGGILRGITRGSLFCLVPQAEKIATQGALLVNHILVLVDEVDSFQSTASLLGSEQRHVWKDTIHPRFLQDQGGLPSVAPGWDAVELVHNYGDQRLSLYIEKELVLVKKHQTVVQGVPLEAKHLPADFRNLLEQLAKENIVDLVSDIQKAHAILRLGTKTAAILWAETAPHAPAPILPNSTEGHEPQGLATIELKESSENIAKLERILLQLNKVRNLLALSPTENDLKVSGRLVQIASKGKRWVAKAPILQEKSLLPVLYHKERFGVEFTNESEENVYPTVVYIDSNLEVKVLFPPKGAPYAVAPGQTKLLLPLHVDTSETAGRETVKIMVATIPLELHELELPRLDKTRAAAETATEKTALGKLAFESVFGQKRKGLTGKVSHRSASILENPPQWAVVTLAWQTAKKADKRK